jgi:hypothetical protein
MKADISLIYQTTTMEKVFRFSDFLMFLLGALVCFLLMTSCSKPNDLSRTTSDNSVPKIEFVYNGELKQYFDISAGSSRTSGVKYYTLVGTKAPQGDNVFSMTILTDSLKAGSYNMNTGIVSFQEGKTVCLNKNNAFTVTITSNVNGLINGTFQGTFYNASTSSDASCIQGKIENIQLIYK